MNQEKIIGYPLIWSCAFTYEIGVTLLVNSVNSDQTASKGQFNLTLLSLLGLSLYQGVYMVLQTKSVLPQA